MNATVFLDPSLNQEMEDEIELLNTKLDYFEGNLLSAKTKIKTLDKNTKALNYRLTAKNAELDKFKKRLIQLQDEKTELQSHSDRLTSKKVENENLRGRISQLEGDKTRLQSIIDLKKLEKAGNESLQNRIQQLEDEKNVNELLLEKTTNRLQSNLDRLTSEKAENESLRNRIRQLEDKNNELQSEANLMSEEKVENENLRNENRLLEEENSRLQSEWLQTMKKVTNEETHFSSDDLLNGDMSGDYGDEFDDEELFTSLVRPPNSTKYQLITRAK